MCIRCVKAGTPCVDAPPSRQGKRSRDEDLGDHQRDQMNWKLIESNSAHMSTSAQGTVVQRPSLRFVRSILADWDEDHQEELNMLRGLLDAASVPSRDAVRWAVRHLAAVATARDAKPLFEGTMRLAACYAIPIGEVILDVEAEMPSPDYEITKGFQDMREALEKSSVDEGCFFFCRTLNPTRTGELLLWSSSNFKAQVSDLDELQAHWMGSNGTLWDAFVHPDDLAVIPTALGRIAASMETFDPAKLEGKCEQTTSLLRMRITQPHGVGGSVQPAYVPCHAEVHLGCFTGTYWMCVKAVPLIPAAATSTALAMPTYTPSYPSQPALRELVEAKANPAAGSTVDGGIPEGKAKANELTVCKMSSTPSSASEELHLAYASSSGMGAADLMDEEPFGAGEQDRLQDLQGIEIDALLDSAWLPGR